MSGTVRLSADNVRWLLRGALAAASKDDVTPVLCAVKWTVADGRVTVLATDRYRVHQLFAPAAPNADEGEFLMSRHQAELLLRTKHSSARANVGEVVDLTWTDPVGTAPFGERSTRAVTGSIRFDVLEFDSPEADQITHVSQQVRGNFPPVARLFPDSADASDEGRLSMFALNPEFLSAMRHLRTHPSQPLRFITPKQQEHANKLPVIVENVDGTARALIQPNMLFDSWKRYGA